MIYLEMSTYRNKAYCKETEAEFYIKDSTAVPAPRWARWRHTPCSSLTPLLMRCLLCATATLIQDLGPFCWVPWYHGRRWHRPPGNSAAYESPNEGERAIKEVWMAAVKCATETNLCLICLERWEIPWWHLVMSPKVVEVRFFWRPLLWSATE